MTDFEQSSQNFLTWLRNSGAELNDKIELADLRRINAGRGVVATQDIAEDELLFRIPRSAVLSVENSILFHEIPKATLDNLGPWLSLILVMLYEYQNKSASNWAPYFDVLPNEFNTLMFWEPDELDELQASAVRNKIGKESADETFKNELVPIIKEFAEIFFSGDERAKERAEEMSSPDNLLLMHKMGSLIMAYAFDVEPAPGSVQKNVDEEGYASEDEDEALPKGMVPMADMLNADADRNNARLFYEENFLTMKALKPITAGDELFNDYGPLPRSDLLRRYGYITNNYAQYDVVEIPLDLIKSELKKLGRAPSTQRLEYLDEQGVLEDGYDISTGDHCGIEAHLSPEFIVLIKALLLPDAEVDRLMKKGKLPKPDTLSKEECQLLREVLSARTKQYATNLRQDHDQDYVTSGSNPPITTKELRYAMARKVRMGEKVILDEALYALSARIDVEESRSEPPPKRQKGE